MAVRGRSYPNSIPVRAAIYQAPTASTISGTATASFGGTFTAAATPTVVATATATFGGSFSTTAVPTILATASASFGGVFAATATPTVGATAAAVFGGSFTAAATIKIPATAVAVFGGVFSASATVTASTSTAGGNLVKPRLHQGNAPGPKLQHGAGRFVYKLTFSGYGRIEQPATLALPQFMSSGELVVAHACSFACQLRSHGIITSGCAHTAFLELRAIGTASEDPDDVLLVALL